MPHSCLHERACSGGQTRSGRCLHCISKSELDMFYTRRMGACTPCRCSGDLTEVFLESCTLADV